MCVVSMIGDHYQDKWKTAPWIYPQPNIYPSNPGSAAGPASPFKVSLGEITRQEFDDLKKEVEEMKALLIKAKEYDERNNEPNCEMEEKVALLRKVAEAVGVDLGDLLPKPTQP